VPECVNLCLWMWKPGCRGLICFLIVCWQVANLLLGVSHERRESYHKLVRQAAYCPAVYNRIVVEADLHTGRQNNPLYNVVYAIGCHAATTASD
jgi:hypothetical protein